MARALFADADRDRASGSSCTGSGPPCGLAAQLAYARGAAAVAGSVGARSRARVRKNVPNIPNANLWTYDDPNDAAADTAPDANANVPLRSLAAAAAHHAWAPFDVALDLVGEARSEKRLARLLRRGRGRLVTAHGDLARLVGERGVARGAALAAAELARKKVLFRVNEDVSYAWSVMRQDAEAMRRIGEYAEAGELTPPNVVAMRLDDAADAHRAHDANETRGKIVLEP